MQAGIHGLVLVGADDGSAGAGKLGAGAQTAGDFHHALVFGADVHDFPPQVKVGVEQGPEVLHVARLQALAGGDGQLGKAVHGGPHRRVAGLIALAQVVVHDLGALGEVGTVGDVEGREQGRVQHMVAAIALPRHDGPAEVHEDRGLIGLGDAVLQPGPDAELFRLDREDEIGQQGGGYLHPVKGHERPHAGGDDGTRPGQAQPVGDVAAVADGEVAVVEGQALGLAVLVKLLDGGLQQADAAIVAVELHIFIQPPDTGKDAAVALLGLDFQLGRLVEDHLGAEVGKDKGDGLAVVTVGGVADEGGPGIGVGADDQSGQKLGLAATCRLVAKVRPPPAGAKPFTPQC